MSKPLLSIIVPGKHDDYYGAFDRLTLNIRKTLSNIEILDMNIQLVLCDWGSTIKITDKLSINTSDRFKCVYVDPEICEKYNNGASYSIVHPINTGFRHSDGKYVIFWDSDCYVPLEDLDRLYKFVEKMSEKSDTAFYWGSRYHIPYDIHHKMIHQEQVDEYLQTCDLSTIDHDKIDINRFMGCSISLLMDRSLWEDSTGWWERLTYWGWQDIEFHNRLLSKYRFGGDLEDFGIKFFHLNHHNLTVNNKRLTNPQMNSPVFKANPPNWGLSDEQLLIY
jgi:hypothetical protein